MKVRLLVTLKLSPLAAGLLVASIAVSLTDSAGAAHSAAINPADLSDDGTGQAVASVDVPDDVPAGDFSGSAQAVDASGANVGDAATFSGTVPAGTGGGTNGDQQWIPVSVTAQFSS